MSRFTRRHLDPGSRLGEILFGLIMVLTVTLTAGLTVTEGRAGVRHLLLATIGSNVAWGIIDAVMYIMNCMIVRRGKLRLVEAVQHTPDPGAAMHLVQDALDPEFQELLPPEEAQAIGRSVVKHITGVHITKKILTFVLKCFGHLDEIVLLSTCNRVEIYGTTRHATGHIKSLLQLLCAEPGDLDPHIYLYEDAAAVRHLLRVAPGLDSLALGETEITGQIKNAYEIARNAGLTGRVLNRLFQRAFQATKEIRSRTGIGRGAVSIKSAAVELVEKTLGDLSRQSIMVIGAGQMAECCVRSLVKKGARSILIANRSFDRAIDLAIQCGGQAVCLGDCLFEMPDVDVVIAATSSPESLLTRDDADNLMRSRHHRPLLLIDLSVPRNIDPAVRGLEHVALYNIDDLEAVARRGVQARERELTTCHQIIAAHVAALTEKLHTEEAQSPWRSAPRQLSTTVLIPQPT